MIQICPRCRSTFSLNDTVDVSAPNIQTLHCPICQQEIWVSSGLIPKRWSVGEVIQNNTDQTLPPPEPFNFEQSIPKEFEKSVWNFSFPSFSGGFENITTGIKTGATVVVIGLALLLGVMIFRR